jgi:DNA-binding winged helix-turn-helix (wHTH) protein
VEQLLWILNKAMRYRLKEFKFDSESLILTKADESVAIRHNEAKVLALLLKQTNKVFSKEEILSVVWQGKVVSEQAVFQNISHLRSLFGNDAIKTFPKRGYQWQLVTEIIPVINDKNYTSASDNFSTDTHTVNQRATLPITSTPSVAKVKHYWPYALMLGMLILFSVLLFSQNKTQEQSSQTLKQMAYIPLSHTQDGKNLPLIDNEYFDFTELNKITTYEFNNTLELTYPKLAQTHPLILTAELRQYNQQHYIDFLVKGAFGEWRGQLTADSTNALIEQLQTHLQKDVIYDLLNKAQTPEIKQANLSIAHQQYPGDLIILGALITVYIEMNELEKAMVMADKMENIAKTKGDWQQLGNALLFQSKVLTRKELYELSSHKLRSSIKYFEQIDDFKRQADAWFAQSWIDHQEKNYLAIKTSLLNSAELSLTAKDIPRELDALTYLSILAYKNNQKADQYFYLQQAENKMKAYQLPIYHFAKIPFHYAFFAKTLSDKEPHWKQVLKYTQLTPDHWVAQSSREQLMQHYLKQSRFAEAKLLLNNLSHNNAKNSYLHALYAQAIRDETQFSYHAQRAFEQARLAGETRLSLDVALLLCGEYNAQINFDFYSQYITENATKYWRQNNKERLLALNF